jgi:predicted enzyme related to lactoylglutathione lyase
MSATAVSTTAASANGTAVAEREHAINWFEIPCQDLERATNFYETVLGRRMQRVSGVRFSAPRHQRALIAGG